MKRIAIAAALGLALVVLLVVVRHGEVGLWDWDTYGRIQFIHEYSAEQYVDGHVLYHGIMRALMAVGASDVGAVVIETALGMAAFLGLLGWICVRQGLAPRMTALVLAVATLGSPGLVALYLSLEDNVLYFPVVLGVIHVLTQVGGERRTVILKGAALGALLAVGMLINISLLVLALALVPAVPLVAIRDRRRALGLVVALGTLLVVYYGAHLVPFSGAQIALHEFLPRALGLEDFAQSTTPLVSLARFEQYRTGLRAIALTPTLHQMVAGPRLLWLLRDALPLTITGCAVTLAGWIAIVRGREVWHAALARIDLVAVIGATVAFPYVYEPYLIERWDMFWIAALCLLVSLLAKPTRLVLGLVGGMLVAQGIGTLVVIAHHYGLACNDPRLAQVRIVAADVAREHGEVVVLPDGIDRVVLADLAFRIGGQPLLYLVRDDGACMRISFLGENPVPCGEVAEAVRSAKHPYVDPAVPRALLR